MKPQRIIDFHVHPRYDFHLANHGVEITDELFRDDLLSCGITAVCGSVIHAWEEPVRIRIRDDHGKQNRACLP